MIRFDKIGNLSAQVQKLEIVNTETFSSLLTNYIEPYKISGQSSVKTKFFTSLNTNFKVGDKVFITNGNYDNRDIFKKNKYRKNSDGYTVLFVNNCEIVLDIDYTSVSPYDYIDSSILNKLIVTNTREEFLHERTIYTVPFKTDKTNNLYSSFLKYEDNLNSYLFNSDINDSDYGYWKQYPTYFGKDNQINGSIINVKYSTNFYTISTSTGIYRFNSLKRETVKISNQIASDAIYCKLLGSEFLIYIENEILHISQNNTSIDPSTISNLIYNGVNNISIVENNGQSCLIVATQSGLSILDLNSLTCSIKHINNNIFDVTVTYNTNGTIIPGIYYGVLGPNYNTYFTISLTDLFSTQNETDTGYTIPFGTQKCFIVPIYNARDNSLDYFAIYNDSTNQINITDDSFNDFSIINDVYDLKGISSITSFHSYVNPDTHLILHFEDRALHYERIVQDFQYTILTDPNIELGKEVLRFYKPDPMNSANDIIGITHANKVYNFKTDKVSFISINDSILNFSCTNTGSVNLMSDYFYKLDNLDSTNPYLVLNNSFDNTNTNFGNYNGQLTVLNKVEKDCVYSIRSISLDGATSNTYFKKLKNYMIPFISKSPFLSGELKNGTFNDGIYGTYQNDYFKQIKNYNFTWKNGIAYNVDWNTGNVSSKSSSKDKTYYSLLDNQIKLYNDNTNNSGYGYNYFINVKFENSTVNTANIIHSILNNSSITNANIIDSTIDNSTLQTSKITESYLNYTSVNKSIIINTSLFRSTSNDSTINNNGSIKILDVKKDFKDHSYKQGQLLVTYKFYVTDSDLIKFQKTRQNKFYLNNVQTSITNLKMEDPYFNNFDDYFYFGSTNTETETASTYLREVFSQNGIVFPHYRRENVNISYPEQNLNYVQSFENKILYSGYYNGIDPVYLLNTKNHYSYQSIANNTDGLGSIDVTFEISIGDIKTKNGDIIYNLTSQDNLNNRLRIFSDNIFSNITDISNSYIQTCNITKSSINGGSWESGSLANDLNYKLRLDDLRTRKPINNTLDHSNPLQKSLYNEPTRYAHPYFSDSFYDYLITDFDNINTLETVQFGYYGPFNNCYDYTSPFNSDYQYFYHTTSDGTTISYNNDYTGTRLEIDQINKLDDNSKSFYDMKMLLADSSTPTSIEFTLDRSRNELLIGDELEIGDTVYLNNLYYLDQGNVKYDLTDPMGYQIISIDHLPLNIKENDPSVDLPSIESLTSFFPNTPSIRDDFFATYNEYSLINKFRDNFRKVRIIANNSNHPINFINTVNNASTSRFNRFYTLDPSNQFKAKNVYIDTNYIAPKSIKKGSFTRTLLFNSLIDNDRFNLIDFETVPNTELFKRDNLRINQTFISKSNNLVLNRAFYHKCFISSVDLKGGITSQSVITNSNTYNIVLNSYSKDCIMYDGIHTKNNFLPFTWTEEGTNRASWLLESNIPYLKRDFQTSTQLQDYINFLNVEYKLYPTSQFDRLDSGNIYSTAPVYPNQPSTPSEEEFVYKVNTILNEEVKRLRRNKQTFSLDNYLIHSYNLTVKGGIVCNQDFMGGIFDGGKFYNGIFRNGTFKSGILGNKKIDASKTQFYPKWIDYSDTSLPEYEPVWLNGTVENAYFSGTVWNDGIFDNGIYNAELTITNRDGSVQYSHGLPVVSKRTVYPPVGLVSFNEIVRYISNWKTGIFNNGTILGETIWENGIFNGGKFYSNYINYVTSGTDVINPLKYNKLTISSIENSDNYSWLNGTFNGGTFGDSKMNSLNPSWFNGTFKNGTFNGLVWKSGIFVGGKFIGDSKSATSLPLGLIEDGTDYLNLFKSFLNTDSVEKDLSKDYDSLENQYSMYYYFNTPSTYEHDYTVFNPSAGFWYSGSVKSTSDETIVKSLYDLDRFNKKNQPPIEFSNVYWNDGIFDSIGATITNSVWLGGSFNNGIFKNSVFNPYSYRRFSNNSEHIVEYNYTNCTWNNGILENSLFNISEWNNGLFKSGLMFGGYWKNGTAYYGDFVNTIWTNGTFKNGNWYGSDFNIHDIYRLDPHYIDSNPDNTNLPNVFKTTSTTETDGYMIQNKLTESYTLNNIRYGNIVRQNVIEETETINLTNSTINYNTNPYTIKPNWDNASYDPSTYDNITTGKYKIGDTVSLNDADWKLTKYLGDNTFEYIDGYFKTFIWNALIKDGLNDNATENAIPDQDQSSFYGVKKRTTPYYTIEEIENHPYYFSSLSETDSEFKHVNNNQLLHRISPAYLNDPVYNVDQIARKIYNKTEFETLYTELYSPTYTPYFTDTNLTPSNVHQPLSFVPITQNYNYGFYDILNTYDNSGDTQYLSLFRIPLYHLLIEDKTYNSVRRLNGYNFNSITIYDSFQFNNGWTLSIDYKYPKGYKFKPSLNITDGQLYYQFKLKTYLGTIPASHYDYYTPIIGKASKKNVLTIGKVYTIEYVVSQVLEYSRPDSSDPYFNTNHPYENDKVQYSIVAGGVTVLKFEDGDSVSVYPTGFISEFTAQGEDLEILFKGRGNIRMDSIIVKEQVKIYCGNGSFINGVWENGIWNSGTREENQFGLESSIVKTISLNKTLKSDDRNFDIELYCSTGFKDIKAGDIVSVSNIVGIDINDNRKILSDSFVVKNVTSTTMTVNVKTVSPLFNITIDSTFKDIRVSKNVWLNGTFKYGNFEGIFNNGIVDGYPKITLFNDTHFINGTFTGGYFNGLIQNVDAKDGFTSHIGFGFKSANSNPSMINNYYAKDDQDYVAANDSLYPRITFPYYRYNIDFDLDYTTDFKSSFINATNDLMLHCNTMLQENFATEDLLSGTIDLGWKISSKDTDYSNKISIGTKFKSFENKLDVDFREFNDNSTNTYSHNLINTGVKFDYTEIFTVSGKKFLRFNKIMTFKYDWRKSKFYSTEYYTNSSLAKRYKHPIKVTDLMVIQRQEGSLNYDVLNGLEFKVTTVRRTNTETVSGFMPDYVIVGYDTDIQVDTDSQGLYYINGERYYEEGVYQFTLTPGFTNNTLPEPWIPNDKRIFSGHMSFRKITSFYEPTSNDQDTVRLNNTSIILENKFQLSDIGRTTGSNPPANALAVRSLAGATLDDMYYLDYNVSFYPKNDLKLEVGKYYKISATMNYQPVTTSDFSQRNFTIASYYNTERNTHILTETPTEFVEYIYVNKLIANPDQIFKIQPLDNGWFDLYVNPLTGGRSYTIDGNGNVDSGSADYANLILNNIGDKIIIDDIKVEEVDRIPLHNYKVYNNDSPQFNSNNTIIETYEVFENYSKQDVDGNTGLTSGDAPFKRIEYQSQIDSLPKYVERKRADMIDYNNDDNTYLK